jgi:hypothetical protein
MPLGPKTQICPELISGRPSKAPKSQKCSQSSARRIKKEDLRNTLKLNKKGRLKYRDSLF